MRFESMTDRYAFPNGKKFAFTVIDDTDVATVDNVKPVYDLLYALGLRTTKTVWPLGCPEGSPDFSSSQTLEDDRYADFVVDLARRGFEVTWHGATMETSTRERTTAALNRFRQLFGSYPRIHVNHALNRENVYWGLRRMDSPVLRALFKRVAGWSEDYFVGETEGSPYWWGDICREHFVYCRNLTTNSINTARFNPSTPYRDPVRPIVRWWFSASDAEDVHEFNELIHPDRQQQLEDEGGFCIVATHFGKDFVRDGALDKTTASRLRQLSQRPGWFPTAGELLDWLRITRASRSGESGLLPRTEWTRMQWHFAADLLTRRVKRRIRALRPTAVAAI